MSYGPFEQVTDMINILSRHVPRTWKNFKYTCSFLLLYFSQISESKGKICKVTIIPKVKKKIPLNTFFFFRVSELIALVSVSTTLFLFIQTRDLSNRLHEIQDPNLDLTGFDMKIDSGKSGGSGGGLLPELTKPKSYLSRELSNEKSNVSAKICKFLQLIRA